MAWSVMVLRYGGNPNVRSGFARFLLHDGRGVVAVYSKRFYGDNAHLRTELALIRKKDAGQLPVDKPVTGLGADDLDVVEWQMAAERVFRVDIPNDKLFDPKSNSYAKESHDLLDGRHRREFAAMAQGENEMSYRSFAMMALASATVFGLIASAVLPVGTLT